MEHCACLYTYRQIQAYQGTEVDTCMSALGGAPGDPLDGLAPAGWSSAATLLDENATRMKERALGDVVMERGDLFLHG
jgi:hypothetical protein